jgi:hypothetical protein
MATEQPLKKKKGNRGAIPTKVPGPPCWDEHDENTAYEWLHADPCRIPNSNLTEGGGRLRKLVKTLITCCSHVQQRVRSFPNVTPFVHPAAGLEQPAVAQHVEDLAVRLLERVETEETHHAFSSQPCATNVWKALSTAEGKSSRTAGDLV